MNLLKNKQGASLPFVLGLLLFIVTSTIIVVTSVTTQSIQVANDYQRTEAYVNAQNLVKATVEIIVRDQNTTSTYLNDLATHMGVEITTATDDIFSISVGVSEDVTVKSYLKATTEEVTNYDIYDEFLFYDGLESTYEQNPLLTPAVMLSSYLDTFLNDTFGANTYNENFSDFTSIFNFMENLASEGTTYTIEDPDILEDQRNPTVYGHWFIDGNVTLGNDDDLVIPNGYLLFIDGNLTMKKRSQIEGNVVVNGNVKIDSNSTDASLLGTVYASGDFKAERSFDLGTFWEPSFILIDGTFNIDRYMEGYGYIIADKVQADRNRTDIEIYGGVYSDNIINLDDREVNRNYWVFYTGVGDAAISETIAISTGSTSGGIIFTSPK